jgi:hypothetical protein
MPLASPAKASLLLAYDPRPSFGSSADSIAQAYGPIDYNDKKTLNRGSTCDQN